MLRTRFLLPSAALLAVTLAACGGGSSDVAAPGDGGDAPPAAGMCHVDQPDCDDTGIGDDPGMDGAELVEPRDGIQNLRARPWEDVLVDEDQRTLTISFWSGVEPCYVLGEVDVEESDEAVTITLYEGNEPADEDVACIDIAMQKKVVVQLDTDLGPRSILDGAEA